MNKEKNVLAPQKLHLIVWEGAGLIDNRSQTKKFSLCYPVNRLISICLNGNRPPVFLWLQFFSVIFIFKFVPGLEVMNSFDFWQGPRPSLVAEGVIENVYQQGRTSGMIISDHLKNLCTRSFT